MGSGGIDGGRVGGYKTSCPVCPSSDAYHIYDDGGSHCFSCHFHTFSDQVKLLERMARDKDEPQKPQEVKPLTLPDGCSSTIGHKALNWLHQYGITREEIIEHKLQWDDDRQWLVFPFRGTSPKDGWTGPLLGYQARCFTASVHRKWYSQGDLSKLGHHLGFTKHGESAIILVEDIVSAIKVSRHARCVPLFGSNISPVHLLRLKYFTKKLIIWLDKDKYKEAISGAKRAEMIGMESYVVYTEDDPKACTDEHIKNVVAM
jgi:hypothetical protein